MDPLIRLYTGIVTTGSLIQLPYYQVEECEFDIQPLDLSQYSTQLTNIHDEVNEMDDAYSINLIRDLVDNINLPKTKNRAENKLLNMITICKWLVEPPSDRVLEGYPLGELYSSAYDTPLRVYDCAAGPGGWSSWILKNYPNSEVVGFTLKGDNPDFYWYPELLSHSRFHGYYGNLLTEWKTNTELVKNTHFTADLFMSDGGISFEMLRPDEVYDRSIEHRRIVASGRMRLILAQILAALNITAVDGSIIIKLFNVDHPILHQLLTVAGSCCQYSTIVKLITSRSQNREMFYIGLYRKPDVSLEIEILSGILDNWEELYPMSIITQIPRQVQQFLEFVINEELDNHLQAVEMSNQLLRHLQKSNIRIRKGALMRHNLSKYQLYPGMNRYILYGILGIVYSYMH